jgi:GPI-GlcNAc transferase complex, PIG-H component
MLYEGFKGLELRYYLAVVVEGEERVEVVFPVSTPILNA